MSDEYDYEEYDDYNYELEFCKEDSNTNTLPQLINKQSYKIIKEDEAIIERESIINQASNRLDMNRDSLILALIYFKWDIDILAERWYDKPIYYSTNSGVEQSPESIKELNSKKIFPNNTYCPVCYTDEADLNKDDFYGLSCGHKFCRECWEEFLSEKLKEINSAILTNCPQQGCNCYVTESVFFKTLGKKKSSPAYRSYLKSILKNFTDFNSVIKPCPFPGCESYIQCDRKGNIEVTCSYCDNTSCFKCSQNGHRPCPCEMLSAWEKKNNSESENVKWLTVNTKKCPNCHKHIEKNQGCNHMTCQKQAGGCGYEFCWICLAKWAGHKDCNKFEEAAQDKSKKELKHELDKYVFYYDRYMNHFKSLNFANKMKPVMELNIVKLHDRKMIPHIDLMFLKEGVLTVINSRRLLLNSYIFAFYIEDKYNKSSEKSLFEFHQGILEKNSDKIHGLLENVQIESLLSIDNLEEFNHNFNIFKNNIIDLYTATNKFCSNLITSVETNLMDKIKF